MRLALLLAVAAAAALPLQGCALRGTKAKAGHPVNVCAGVGELDAISEPILTSQAAALDFASSHLRVLDRIDLEIRYLDTDGKLHEAPKEVVDHLAVVKTGVTTYRGEVQSAEEDVAKLRVAAAGLASNKAFAAASTALTQFHSAHCPAAGG